MSTRLIGLILLALGLGLSSYLWQLAKTARQAQSWPTTKGTMAISEVESRPARHADNAGRLEYQARLLYHYQVAGQSYQSDQLRLPNPGYSRSQQLASEIVQRYPPGSSVLVYYNPDKPTQAYLQTGPHWSSWLGLALGLALSVAGLCLLVKSS
ncbi:DUF3592 domain-containing protein [Neisseriaceae bacterium TC5R-5]|nr:DUF3592 domain-containing protein [Neisseriaceae bacterium TC5R-5]